MVGTIQKFEVLRGFGIILMDFRTRLFFHISEYRGTTEPNPGQQVEFDVRPPRKPGELNQAVNIVPVLDASQKQGGSEIGGAR